MRLHTGGPDVGSDVQNARQEGNHEEDTERYPVHHGLLHRGTDARNGEGVRPRDLPCLAHPRLPETPGTCGAARRPSDALRFARSDARQILLHSHDLLASNRLILERTGQRIPEVRLKRVIADVQHAARVTLVAAAAIQDEPRVAAAPCPHGALHLRARTAP